MNTGASARRAKTAQGAAPAAAATLPVGDEDREVAHDRSRVGTRDAAECNVGSMERPRVGPSGTASATTGPEAEENEGVAVTDVAAAAAGACAAIAVGVVPVGVVAVDGAVGAAAAAEGEAADPAGAALEVAGVVGAGGASTGADPAAAVANIAARSRGGADPWWRARRAIAAMAWSASLST